MTQREYFTGDARAPTKRNAAMDWRDAKPLGRRRNISLLCAAVLDGRER
jgi:hypothetical protein